LHIAGEGGKKLENPLLNIHPIMPNTHYKIENNSTYSDDTFGRVKKWYAIIANEI
jgi:hypothetical protein